MDEFYQNAGTDYLKSRELLRDHYTLIERLARSLSERKDILQTVSLQTNIFNRCRENVDHIVTQPYIKSNSFNFKIRPGTIISTNLIREAIENNEDGNHTIEKAIFQLVKEIRDNLTHDGKFEIGEQKKRNLLFVSNAASICQYVSATLEEKLATNN